MKTNNRRLRKFSIRKLAVGTTSVLVGTTILLSSTVAHAQTSTAQASTTNTSTGIDQVVAPGYSPVSDIYGYVQFDQNEDGIPDINMKDVVVELINVDTGLQFTSTTDINGYYYFPRVKAGNYEVIFGNIDSNDSSRTITVPFSTNGYRKTKINITLLPEKPVDPPTTETPTTEPSTQEPVTTEPVTTEPSTQEPSTQEPSTQEPVTTEPSTQEPSTQEPVTTEPSTQEPAKPEPTLPSPVLPPVLVPHHPTPGVIIGDGDNVSDDISVIPGVPSPTKQPNDVVATNLNPIVIPQVEASVSPLILPNIKMESVITKVKPVSKNIETTEKVTVNKSHHNVKKTDKKVHTKTKSTETTKDTEKEDSNSINVVTNNHKKSPQKNKRMKQEFKNNKADIETLPSADLLGMPTFITGFGGSIL